ncbi:MAG: SUMF1/EgtB/PvdO family nonheme iron enzyme (plasmid) [Nodularia sp. CChRGM 3473]
MPKIVINRTQKTAQYYVEELGNGITLDMVLIPEGSFLMGSPEKELERRDSESPQHLVKIQQFCIGKYQVTQEQWKAVAALPQVNRELKLDPSEFKGANRPVEQVSWYDAVEFCDRLAAHTKRSYRLPSEAEWEYACRAGTTTPFHFGETITTDVANYRGMNNEKEKWSGSYGRGPKGIYRGETTDVGSFGVANGFGLYDMHGNVWEWCADYWQINYEGSPTNGGAWLTTEDNSLRLLRGGSWRYVPAYCRSAYRNPREPNSRFSNIGFRVVCDGLAVISQDNLRSEVDVDYTKLRDLLKAKKWQEANNETYLVMLQAVGKDKRDLLNPEDISDFPCTDLYTIDNLWLKYSNQHFGFSVQRNIYLKVGGKLDGKFEQWIPFCERLGWRKNNRPIISSEANYTIWASEGHLPGLRWELHPIGSYETARLLFYLFERLDYCPKVPF